MKSTICKAVGFLFLALTLFSIWPHKLTWEEARVLTEAARQETDFPIELNADVFNQLKTYYSARGKLTLTINLLRLHFLRSVLVAPLVDKNIPLEVLAIPWVETGFRNEKIGDNSGVWSFTTYTAQRYDLLVSQDADQRRDVAASTQAMATYFSVLKSMFHDWRLAIIANHHGEGFVWRTQRSLETADPWAIARTEVSEGQYLAKIMAAVIYLRGNHHLQ